MPAFGPTLFPHSHATVAHVVQYALTFCAVDEHVEAVEDGEGPHEQGAGQERLPPAQDPPHSAEHAGYEDLGHHGFTLPSSLLRTISVMRKALSPLCNQ